MTTPRASKLRGAAVASSGAGALYALAKIRRVYRYNFLPRYAGPGLEPYAGTPAELNGRPLGRYYADLRSSIRNYDFDSSGIIRLLPGGNASEAVYNPCLVAQYALLRYEDVLAGDEGSNETSVRLHLDWLQSNATPVGEGRRVLFYDYDTPEERAPWGSGIAQGMAISALLRGYEHFGHAPYLETAHELFAAMDAPTPEGGFRYSDERFALWYEEDNRGGHILNGHLFALMGVQDLYRLTADERYRERRDLGLRAVKENIDAYDLGFTTRYRAINGHAANNAYHYMHAGLFRIVFQITGDEFFAATSDRFYAYHSSTRYRLRNFAHLLTRAATAKLGL